MPLPIAEISKEAINHTCIVVLRYLHKYALSNLCIEYICVNDGFLIRYYVWACVLFPFLFYIPKWFEAEYLLDLPKACYRLKEVSDCLVTVGGNVSAVRDRKLLNLARNLVRDGKITKLLSISCWNANATVTEQVRLRFLIKVELKS